MIDVFRKFGKTSMKLSGKSEDLDCLEIPAGTTVGFWTEKGYKVYVNGELVTSDVVVITITNEAKK